MPQTRIKRVVYPRIDIGDTQTGRLFSQLPIFDPATNVGVVPNSFVPLKRKSIDVRTHITEHTGWVSEFAMQPKYAVPGNTLRNPGFIQPKGKSLSLHYHAPWVDDGGWRFSAIPVSTYTPSLYPAMAAQALSFRVAKQSRFKPVRTGTPRPGFNDALTPTFAQLVDSYLMAARSKQKPYFHDWQDDQAGIFFNVPAPTFSPAFSVIASEYNYWMPDENTRGHHLLWNSVERSSGAAQEEEREWIPSFIQLLHSYRSLYHKLLDLRKYEWNDQGWLGFSNRVTTVPETVPALEQLFGGYLVGKRKGLPYDQLDYNDFGWVGYASTFDPAIFAGIDFLLHAFRQAEGRKLNVRYLDTPHDQWISYNPEIELQTWTGAFYSLFNSYRSEKRKSTLDTLRVEDFHDFAWLRAVLDLTDAPFGIPVAHWRHIEGAIRSRRRRRRGR